MVTKPRSGPRETLPKWTREVYAPQPLALLARLLCYGAAIVLYIFVIGPLVGTDNAPIQIAAFVATLAAGVILAWMLERRSR